MSSPITFGGFNNIDFTSIINALVTQRSATITLAQQQQNDIQSKLSSLNTLESRIDSVRSKAASANSSLLFLKTAATSSNTSVFTVSSNENAAVADYSIQVSKMAKAQSIVSSSTYGSASDVVATGGSIVVAGKTVTISGSTTLQQFANQINGTAGIGARATVVDTGGSAYKLVVTANSTGTSNAFTISGNALTGGSGVTFTDTDSDGTYGDSVEDNTVNAKNAEVYVNGLLITRSSNTINDAIAGVTLNLLKEDPGSTHTLNVKRDTASIVSALQDFASSYNDFASYVNAEYTIGATTDEPGPLAGEAVLRTARSSISQPLRESVSVGGTYSYLSEVGITFDRNGNLQVDSATLTNALNSKEADVQALLQGTLSANGVLDKLVSSIDSLTGSDGIVTKTTENFNNAIDTLSDQILDMNDALELYRQSLVQQFAAVDQLMSQLNSFTSTLQGLQSTNYGF